MFSVLVFEKVNELFYIKLALLLDGGERMYRHNADENLR